MMIVLFIVLARNKLRIPLEGTYSRTHTPLCSCGADGVLPQCSQRVVSIFPWDSTGAEFQPPSALVGQPRPPQESLAVCVCPGPDRCLLPNVARHTAGGTEQAVTQRPQAGREGPRHLRTWCKRTQPRTRTHRRAARATCACTAYPRSPHSRQCHSPSRRSRSLLPRPSQRLRSQSLKSAPPHI